MARNVRIASIAPAPRPIEKKKPGQTSAEMICDWLRRNIEQVLPDRPDLIVLPEACDQPSGITHEEVIQYYEERGSLVLDYVRSVARENHCYVAYGAVRKAEDGVLYNSCTMIDRRGEIVGYYDKNYPTVYEDGVLPGECEMVFECDFGRVGAIICFDLNFEEMRGKYKQAGVDVVLFLSMFGGGVMRNFFAYDTQSYFVAACANASPAEIISPLGESVGSSSNYHNYVVRDINLDCKVCHLDFNWEKIRAAKKKYGTKLQMRDPGYVGVVLLSYEGEDRTILDVIREFEIETADEYFARSRAHREQYLPKD